MESQHSTGQAQGGVAHRWERNALDRGAVAGLGAAGATGRLGGPLGLEWHVARLRGLVGC